jgi:adenylosuccinate lyase
MQVWESRCTVTLRDAIESDPQVTEKLDKKSLDTIFDYEHYIKNIDGILKRALK